jgi:hypothetical protein
MIAECLDRDYVVSETRAQRDWLAALRQKALKKDKAALAELRQHKMTTAQLARAIAALDDALARAKADKKHPQGSAYIPNDPVICGLQTGLTQIAVESGQVRANAPAPVKAAARRGRGFCACLGHGGVPVTKKNLAVENRISDVLWRRNGSTPMRQSMRASAWCRSASGGSIPSWEPLSSASSITRESGAFPASCRAILQTTVRQWSRRSHAEGSPRTRQSLRGESNFSRDAAAWRRRNIVSSKACSL